MLSIKRQTTLTKLHNMITAYVFIEIVLFKHHYIVHLYSCFGISELN